ncbi:MAG: rod shape-determining protein MreB [Oscillospiraceae bacterium]|nr:rod shape-determining protein MreB [Oscillospiraceae bacterium]
MKIFSNDIGIDLGTATVLVYVKGKGIVLKEPSVVAVDIYSNKIYAVGEEARKMLGRTPDAIQAIRPLADGVISDYDLTEQMLKAFINKVCKKRLIKPRIMICVPSGVTEVEQRAVIDAAKQAGARKVYIIEEPIAAAIGAGLDISRPRGMMIVDIGGGTADVAVISLGSIVVSRSIKVAGDEFDEAVVKYIRKKYSLNIGMRTAEDVKISIGCVYPREKDISIDIRGGSLLTGLPQTIQVTSEEIRAAFEDVVIEIIDEVKAVLEETPPELVGDILEDGILLTGGGSLVHGLDKRLKKETGIDVYLADDIVSCVAKGSGIAIEGIDAMNDPTHIYYKR